MAITLKTLIKVAPFSAEKRKMVLEKFDTLSDDQRYLLAKAAWTGLSVQYHAGLKYEKEKLLLEVKDGKRTYNQNDFTEAEVKVLHDFAQRLESAGSEEQISEVRQQLDKYKTQPFVQDDASSPPPVQQSLGQVSKN